MVIDPSSFRSSTISVLECLEQFYDSSLITFSGHNKRRRCTTCCSGFSLKNTTLELFKVSLDAPRLDPEVHGWFKRPHSHKHLRLPHWSRLLLFADSFHKYNGTVVVTTVNNGNNIALWIVVYHQWTQHVNI